MRFNGLANAFSMLVRPEPGGANEMISTHVRCRRWRTHACCRYTKQGVWFCVSVGRSTRKRKSTCCLIHGGDSSANGGRPKYCRATTMLSAARSRQAVPAFPSTQLLLHGNGFNKSTISSPRLLRLPSRAKRSERAWCLGRGGRLGNGGGDGGGIGGIGGKVAQSR